MAETTNIEWAPTPKRFGPKAKPGRDGDKLQARARVNVAVRRGELPNPNALACTDCGHIGPDHRHEYDHHKGYAAEHHFDVEPVCSKCHKQRDCLKAKMTVCVRGHAFTPENTARKPTGQRVCIECRRIHDRNRQRPPGYWKAVNDRRRGRG